MGEDEAKAEAVKSGQADSAVAEPLDVPDPSDVNERADAIDESTDGDGVARLDLARDPGAE